MKVLRASGKGGGGSLFDRARLRSARAGRAIVALTLLLSCGGEVVASDPATQPTTATIVAPTARSTLELANRLAAADDPAAVELYDRAAELADTDGDALLAATAYANASLVDASRAAEAQRRVEALPAGRTKGYLLLNVAHGFVAGGQPQAAFDAARAAQSLGEQLADVLLQSYAIGYLGELYTASAQRDDALAATRKALFLAQQARSPDATFKFQWQLARLLRTENRAAALDAYRRALVALRGIRHDIAISMGSRNPKKSFRTQVGPIFYETADLLLRGAERIENPEQSLAALKEARDTIEQLKSAELEDYFQDDCVNLIKEKARGVDVGLVRTAVVYVIPLPDRTELLVSTPAGLSRRVSPATSDQIAAEARELRLRLEDELDYGYRQHARQLYAWLIAPIEQALISEGIDTLVFVPDGELRTVPMGALFDGKQHLIEKFAVAIVPGLSLTDPQPLAARSKVEVLAAGLSESRQNFPALPAVPEELSRISTMYGGVKLVDEQFQRSRFARQFSGESYTIVHIASHGQFKGDAKDTFVLTYEDRLNLNDLEKLIQPSQFRGAPVELLTLSACQTAAGDDGARAALGLAGVAIKAGARSALATLWSVNDAASTELIGGFYRRLREDSSVTKAQALRAAQIELLRQPRYRHPRYWAPYLIIGNWM